MLAYAVASTRGETPEREPAAAYLWHWFGELASARQSNGWSAQSIPHSEIWAWAQVSGISLIPWEARMLRRLDDEVLPVLREIAKTAGSGSTPISANDGTSLAAMFRGRGARREG